MLADDRASSSAAPARSSSPRQLVRGARRAGDDVRDADAVARQLGVLVAARAAAA